MKASDNPEVRAVEDAAWSLKDVAADLDGRSLSAPDKAALGSVLRDLQRLTDRLVAVRDKRKRGNGAAEAQQQQFDEPEPTHASEKTAQ